MSFLMLLQTPLKFWQMCKKSLAKISGTPQFFIRHVNIGGGRWNCLCTPTSRLTGRQGRCVSTVKLLFLFIRGKEFSMHSFFPASVLPRCIISLNVDNSFWSICLQDDNLQELMKQNIFQKLTVMRKTNSKLTLPNCNYQMLKVNAPSRANISELLAKNIKGICIMLP